MATGPFFGARGAVRRAPTGGPSFILAGVVKKVRLSDVLARRRPPMDSPEGRMAGFWRFAAAIRPGKPVLAPPSLPHGAAWNPLASDKRTKLTTAVKMNDSKSRGAWDSGPQTSLVPLCPALVVGAELLADGSL